MRTTTTSTSSPSHSSSSSSTTHPSPYTIPFSWEEQPGISKHCIPNNAQQPQPALPLPPPIRPKPTPPKKRPDNADPCFMSDPFVAALVECSRPDRWKDRSSEPTLARRTAKERVGLGLKQALSPLDLYGSCRSGQAVADSTVHVRRSGQQLAAYTLLHRRHHC